MWKMTNTLLCRLCFQFWIYFTLFSSVSILNFEPANIFWEAVLIISMRSHTFYSNSIEIHKVAKQNTRRNVFPGKCFWENNFNQKCYYFCCKSFKNSFSDTASLQWFFISFDKYLYWQMFLANCRVNSISISIS